MCTMAMRQEGGGGWGAGTRGKQRQRALKNTTHREGRPGPSTLLEPYTKVGAAQEARGCTGAGLYFKRQGTRGAAAKMGLAGSVGHFIVTVVTRFNT